MVNLKSKVVKFIKPCIEIETFQKKEAIFTTTDGKTHKNSNYNWCKISGLVSKNMEKYAMISITSDGYIRDNDAIIYPLTNIISIQWNLLVEIRKIERYKDHYDIWFTDEELEEMKDVE